METHPGYIDPGSRTERRSRRHRSSRRGMLVAIASLLGVSTFLLAVIAIILGGRLTAMNYTNQALSEDLYRADQKVRELVPQLEARELELRMMVEERLPNLYELTPDQVISVDHAYIKNIVFAVINRGGDAVLEYRLVMENSTPRRIQPRFRVLVFDRMGVQVGSDEVLVAEELLMGESRSHVSIVERFLDNQPHYFAIDFKNHRGASLGNSTR